MKNLLIYINSQKCFDDEHARLAKIQVDNSLLYWRPEDIIIATNFPYEYKGIKSLIVPDDLFCDFEPRNSKGNGIIHLLEKNILAGVTWVHDFEAFQNAPFEEIDLKKDLGLTDYGWKPKWNTGSFFFTPNALDIFKALKLGCYQKKAPDEPILWDLYRNNFNNIQNRYQKMNITFNIGKRHLETTIPMAEKPIRVVHFHPYERSERLETFKQIPISDKLAKLLDKNNPKNKK